MFDYIFFSFKSPAWKTFLLINIWALCIPEGKEKRFICDITSRLTEIWNLSMPVLDQNLSRDQAEQSVNCFLIVINYLVMVDFNVLHEIIYFN